MRRGAVVVVVALAALAAAVGVAVTRNADAPESEVAATADEGTPSGGSAVSDEHGEARALLRRTAMDGTRVSAVQVRSPGAWAPHPDGGGGRWIPPPECRPSGELEIGLSGQRHVALAGAPEYEAVPDGAMLAGFGVAGHPSVTPFLFGAVRVTDDVRSVRLVLDDAVVDEAEPEQGWAIVATELPRRASEGDVRPPDAAHVEVVTADGVERLEPGEAERAIAVACSPPPPSLPAGVGAADDDRAAAIAAVYQDAFGKAEGDPPDDLGEHVQDADAIDDDLRRRIRELGEGYGDVEVEVGEVGIVDDDSAVVVFQLPGLLGWKIGDAELVGGRWLVGAQTFCHMIGISSIPCPPSMWDESRGSSRYAS